jgi:hypothetical protein
MKALRALMPLLLAPALAAGAGPADGLPGAFRSLLAEDDPCAVRRKLGALCALCGGDVKKVKALIASDTAYEALRPGWRRHALRVTDGNTPYDVEFFVRVPAGYTPERSWPLLLAAHGQHGSGRGIGRTMQHVLGAQRDRYILLAPTMPGPAHYNARPYQEQAYLAPLGWARRKLNVDDDRIYVSGYSQGGHVTWHLCVMYPRLFAAGIALAGAPVFQGMQVTHDLYLENLSNLPLWAVWGEKDAPPRPAKGNADLCRIAAARLKALGNETFRGTELPGRGHDGCWPDPNRFRRFLAAHRRRPVPDSFQRRFHLAHHARGYYLAALELAGEPLDLAKPLRVRMPPSRRPPTNEEGLAALKRHVRRNLYSLGAELDRSANSLRIRCRRVPEVRLFVMDGMFDDGRDVHLRFGARRWRGRIAPSARCILTHYAATRDQTALVLNEVALSARGKVTIRYE